MTVIVCTEYLLSGNQSIAASTTAVSFFVYKNAVLFPSTRLANKSQDGNEDVKRIVASHVISATVNGTEVKNLPVDNPVETLFALNMITVSVAACIFFFIHALIVQISRYTRQFCLREPVLLSHFYMISYHSLVHTGQNCRFIRERERKKMCHR